MSEEEEIHSEGEEEEEAPIVRQKRWIPSHGLRHRPKKLPPSRRRASASWLSWLCCCCPHRWSCCCCGPCLGGCLRWLLLCASLCFAALLVGTVYIRSRRSCCGESADLCLIYASLRLPTEYEAMLAPYQDPSPSVSKHTLRRAFDHCLSYGDVSTRAGRSSADCYHDVLQCMNEFVLSRHVHDMT